MVSFGNGNVAKQAQRPGQRRARIGQRLQHRAEVFELLDQILLGLVDRVGGQRAELAELIERVGEVLALVVEHGQRVGNGLQRLVDDRFLRGELADQTVQALGGGDDVAGLVVEVARRTCRAARSGCAGRPRGRRTRC